MAIEESGLFTAIERKRSPVKRETTLRSFDVPFQDYVLLYAAGCSLSTFVFVVEACCSRGRSVRRIKKLPLKSRSYGTIDLSRGWKRADRQLHHLTGRHTAAHRLRKSN